MFFVVSIEEAVPTMCVEFSCWRLWQGWSLGGMCAKYLLLYCGHFSIAINLHLVIVDTVESVWTQLSKDGIPKVYRLWESVLENRHPYATQSLICFQRTKSPKPNKCLSIWCLVRKIAQEPICHTFTNCFQQAKSLKINKCLLLPEFGAQHAS